MLTIRQRSRDSVVGTATRYGLEGPGIESRWGRDFPHLSRPAPAPTQRPVRRVPGLSLGGKGGRGVMLTTHPLLVQRLRKSWAIPPLNLRVTPGPVTGFPLPFFTIRQNARKGKLQDKMTVVYLSLQQVLVVMQRENWDVCSWGKDNSVVETQAHL
jgi:hypothetical protein